EAKINSPDTSCFSNMRRGGKLKGLISVKVRILLTNARNEVSDTVANLRAKVGGAAKFKDDTPFDLFTEEEFESLQEEHLIYFLIGFISIHGLMFCFLCLFIPNFICGTEVLWFSEHESGYSYAVAC